MRNFKRFGRKWQGGWVQYAVPIASALIGALGSKTKTPAPTVQERNPWAPASPYLQQSMAQAQNWGNSPLPYGNPGEMVAPLNPLQTGSVPIQLAGAETAQGVGNTGAAGIMPFLTGQMMDVNNNLYLQPAIQAAIRPQTEAFTEQVLPNIRGNFGGTDAFDNSRQGIAEGIASRGYVQSVGDTAARMANQGYTTGMQATQNAFSQIPTVQSGTMMPGQQVWNVGQALQGQAQQETNARGLYDQLMWQRINQPFNLYNAAGGTAGTQTMTAPQPQGNPALGAIGGALTGMQLYDIWQRSQMGQTPKPFNYTPTGSGDALAAQFGGSASW